jgi:hypothetical protein
MSRKDRRASRLRISRLLPELDKQYSKKIPAIAGIFFVCYFWRRHARALRQKIVLSTITPLLLARRGNPYTQMKKPDAIRLF